MKNPIDEIQTPFYLYNESKLIECIARFKDIAYENKKIYAATMANNNDEILKILKANDIGVFVNSKPHYQKVLDCGYNGSEIIYTSTAIEEFFLKELITQDVIINIDSLKQLELYGSLCEGGKVGIRLNVAEFFLGKISESVNNRIGICEHELQKVKEISNRYNLTINGLHVYLGSDIIDYKYMKESINKTIKVATKIENLEYIDFGGGFPVQGMYGDYFDYNSYSDFISKKMTEISNFLNRSIELIIEPGRSLFGECGTFYTEILDIKERHNQVFICCDSSASIFPRSLFYGEFHDVQTLNPSEIDTYNKPVSIVGQTTYSRDYLAKDIEHFKIQKEKNKLKFLYAGSYCYSMITNFLGQELPDEWLLTKENKLILINKN